MFGKAKRDDEAFLQAVYRACLGRDPDPTGRQLFLGLLSSGRGKWEDVLTGVLGSEEFRSHYFHLIGPSCLHMARKELFRRHIPAAQRVLDLGGAADQHKEGSLFSLGYPHAPEELIIVDMPADRRFTGPSAETQQTMRAERGTEIRYVYRSMAELDFMPDASVDLIVSGESIEHIEEREADTVMRQAYRILRDGGSFCLDTPNARLTRLQSPHALIHPEHKKEYLPKEIEQKLTAAGFQIHKQLGVCEMPESVAQSRFLTEEFFSGTRISDVPENSYLFFFHARKPAR